MIHNLAETEERYKALFYNSHSVMLLLNPVDGGILDANPAAAGFYGWPIKTLRAMNISQINTMKPEEISDDLEKAVRSGGTMFLFQHRRAFGDMVDVEVHSTPININGKILLFVIIHDISERVAANQALLESERNFRLVVESAPEAIFVVSGGRFVYVNGRLFLSLGQNQRQS